PYHVSPFFAVLITMRRSVLRSETIVAQKAIQSPYTPFNDRGQPRLDDGRHNVAVAAERDQAIDVAVGTPQEAKAFQQFSPDRVPLILDPSFYLKALLLANPATLPFRMPIAQARQKANLEAGQAVRGVLDSQAG